MAGTIQNRDAFLKVLKDKRGNQEMPFEPYKPISDLPETHLADKTKEELIAIAREQADFVSANMVETTSSELNQVIADLIKSSGEGQVMIPSTPEFDEFGVKLPEDAKVVQWQVGADHREENIMNAQNSNVAVAFAKFFLAESATVVVESNAGQGRSLHFLPTHYISIIPLSRVLPRSTQAAAYFAEHQKEGSTLHFISGPSNSGDIEMELVVGLHGPLEINYVLVNDL
ncbi:LutC/YkgG family protein [Lactococcus termiticola]|uniref:Lactate utilization protein C n=1 Tax=Lactococcus termiticola TaxID=2169526 RepID=A0A2R5HI52_9LACT|nr:lactate utilization protein C [Lactococcus termiticola]GBG95930.1 lactate utilization protein C [Lactococcus termiticola]